MSDDTSTAEAIGIGIMCILLVFGGILAMMFLTGKI